MTTLNRRQALAGIGIASAAGLAGTSIATASPVPSKAAELVGDWKSAAAAYTEIADRAYAIEEQHPDVVDWPAVRIGLGVPEQTSSSGIDDAFERRFQLLRGAYGEGAEVEAAIAALDRLRLRAHDNLAKLTAVRDKKREACGLAAVDREGEIAAEREEECFQAILDYHPTTAEEEAERSNFLLDFVARYSVDPKVSQIREALFGSSRGSCGDRI